MASVGNFVTANNPGAGGTSHTITFPGALTAHSILVGAVRTGTATTLTSAQDLPNSQTWTIGTHRDQTGRTYIVYFVNNLQTTATTITFTFSGGTSPRLEIFEVIPDDLSGSNTSFDKYGQTAGVDGNSATTGTSLDGGTTATLAHNNEISIGVFSAGADQTYSAGTGYTLVGTGNRMGAVYQVVTSTAAVQALATDTVSSEWIGITATFQIAADSVSGIPPGLGPVVSMTTEGQSSLATMMR